MYVILYLSAIVLANLSVAHFGPGAAIANAFLFIGLDLTARDRLHDAWRGKNLLPKMAALIAAGSALSWLLNKDAGTIALASLAAFAGAAAVDALVYQLLGKYPRWLRINGSNIPSAAVDSLIFPTLAFGGFLWTIALGQFLAKVGGGLVWSLLLTGFADKKPKLAFNRPTRGMVFTIGHRLTYQEGLDVRGKQFYKRGARKPGADFPDGYSGGYVFRTAEDAQRLIDEKYPGKGMAVFGLKARWEKDTTPAKDGWWHNLTRDARIVDVEVRENG